MSHLSNRSKEPGSKGTPRQVITNSFVIRQLPQATFIHYDIVKPKVPGSKSRIGNLPARLANEVISKLQIRVAPRIFDPPAVFDGQKNMYSSHRFVFPNRGDAAQFEVDMSDRKNDNNAPRDRSIYVVDIKKAAEVHPRDLQEVIQGRAHDDKSLTALQLLNLLLRQAAVIKHPAHDRRSIYFEYKKVELGALEIWRGYFQSVRPSIGRMLVNIDISAAVMYRPGNLADLAAGFLCMPKKMDLRVLDHLSPTELHRLRVFLKGVRVTIGKNRDGMDRIKSIQRIEPNAGSFEFLKEDQTMTVEEYFRDFKNKRLHHPGHPGIRTQRGDVIPFELCEVLPNQIFRKTLSKHVADEVLKISGIRPEARLERIKEGYQALNYANSHYVRQAGMVVEPSPLSVSGRLLLAPTINYSNKQMSGMSVREKGGSWNMLGTQFFRPARIESWAVVDFSRARLESIQAFVRQLVKCLRDLGMFVPMEHPEILQKSPQDDIMKVMNEAARTAVESFKRFLGSINKPETPDMHGGKRPTIILAILPDSAADVRKGVKQWGDMLHDVPTQCMKSGKLPGNNQYCNNLGMKINSKLGGINSVIDSPALKAFLGSDKDPAMIVGADVTHPGPGVLRPSVAGLVSSINQDSTRYVARCSAQHPREEIIADLKNLMELAIDDFAKGMNPPQPPRRILFFRDGVSEGEFAKVADIEINRIKEAIDNLWKGRGVQAPKPQITFLVVGKRHHVRFFPTNKTEADRSGNCPAGLVVDTGISNPSVFDFFLQSQGGLLGTSRPSHYIVLHDENNMSADMLQEISFALCHTYARATRSVSIPAPVYYADLVCSRADFHFNPSLNYAEDASTEGGEFDLAKWQGGFGSAKMSQARRNYFM